MIKIITSLFLLCSFIQLHAQSVTSYLTHDVSYVQAYDLEDKNTVEFVKELIEHNYLVIINGDNYFRLKGVLESRWLSWYGHKPACEENLLPLIKSNFRSHLIGSMNTNDNLFASPALFLNDSVKFDFLNQKVSFSINLEKKTATNIQSLDSVSKLELWHEIIKTFSLSSTDSLMLNRDLFQSKS